MTYRYDETHARSLQNPEDLFAYCLPLVEMYINTHRWILKYEFDDVYQELSMALFHYLPRYEPERNVKLLTWIYNNLYFACKSYNRRQKAYQEQTVQFADSVPPTPPEETED